MTSLKKRVAQSVAFRAGFRLHRVNDAFRPDVNLLALACTILEEAPRTFLQVGGNDGVRYDPMRQVAVKYGMSGVILEPLPGPCASLRKVWEDRPEVRVLECAVAPQSGSMPIYVVEPAERTTGRDFTAIASLDRKAVLRHRFNWKRAGGHLTSRAVSTLSPNDLWAKCDDAVDVLAVDIEGLDGWFVMEILGLGKRPALIAYEHIYLSPEEDRCVVSRLRECGYALFRASWDTYATRSCKTEFRGPEFHRLGS